MADVKVSKQQTGEREREQQSQRGLQRRGEAFPSLLSLTPREFFSTSPFTLMRRLTEDMDRMFSSVTAHGGREESAVWMPPIEVFQLDDKIKVCAELPGINKDDVKVEVTEDSLVIQGERKHEHEEKREGYYHSERSYGTFYRSVPLPPEARIDDAKAEFRNGILEVVIPVPESARKSRQIPITGEGEGKKAQAA
ncbi:MAG: Hsp20/alpha crystallin family protein [Acidobacteria bacterium]|nr:Hsp20/alpha crystallin family protein [Acidobacteriota bacterium]